MCVSERGGRGEIAPFFRHLLFPARTDGDSGGERDLVLRNIIEYLQVSGSEAASTLHYGMLGCDIGQLQDLQQAKECTLGKINQANRSDPKSCLSVSHLRY